MNKTNRAIFLDRDGTINVEKNYLWRSEDFEFLPGVPQALKSLQDAGFLLVIVTNQSGVARGYYSLSDVERLHHYVKQQLLGFDVTIAGIYVCPHHPDGVTNSPFSIKCPCRKGEPGMLLQAAEDLGIDLSQSYMIGDKASDIEAGHRAGCSSFLVASGYCDWKNLDLPTYCSGVFSELGEAAKYILQGNNTGKTF